MDEIILNPAQKALASLAKAIEQPKNEFTRDAAIQRFEYSFELTWKVLKRYLATTGDAPEFNIKNLFREAAKRGLKARNLTSHTYNEETYQATVEFLPEAIQLIENIESHLNDD